MEYFSLTEFFADEDGAYSKSSISFDMWGSCRPKNLMRNIRRTACLKPLHIELLRQVIYICESAGVSAFVYGGTALGVYREDGKMLPHDYDIDLAILEYVDNLGTLSKLANFCLHSEIPVSGIDGISKNTISSEPGHNVNVDFRDSFENQRWLFIDNAPNPKIHEDRYCGAGAKRAKFTFTAQGLQSAAKKFTQLKPCQLEALLQDPSSIHVDLFTLSPHPNAPDKFLRVNWHKPSVYNALEKMFPVDAFFPLQTCLFEGLTVMAPKNLNAYLTAEYNYLGRDAMYDYKSQSFMKIPDEVLHKLPKSVQNFFRNSVE